MASSAKQIRRYEGPPVFSFGFRPFFLSGAVVAATLPLLTALSVSGRSAIESGYGPIAYHGHEMLYGYLSAVVAGFTLTAVPNWTGRLPITGARLVVLFAVWLAGRVAVLASGAIGFLAAAGVDILFLVLMSLFIWREVLTGKNWRNLPICVLIALFAAGDVIWHVGALRGEPGGMGVRWGIAVIAMLLAFIGGRVTPSFTRNWMAKTGRAPINAAVTALDKAALILLAIGVAGWVAAPQAAITGWLLIAAAAAHFARLSRWGGWRTFAELLVTILHIGYFWVSLGILLIGLSIIAPAAFPPSAALHALTAGGAGVMTLAVMTRATLGHTGRALTADTPTKIIYGLAIASAVLRTASPFPPFDYGGALIAAGVLWGSAFALFAVIYGRYLLSPGVGAKQSS
ncbi:MAG: NnrS family protein [Parvularculaceae bacterium]